MKDIDFSPKSSKLEHIKILDAKVLTFNSINGIDFKGVSALAYDKKDTLYAISDFGYLYTLKLQIEDKKIKSLVLEDAALLKNKKGESLKKKKSDAEGMVYTEDALLISFEREPKVSLFDFKGNKIKNLELPGALKDVENYQKKNRALESVSMHPDFGLITAPESPLKYEDENMHTIYSLYKRWKFKRDSRITAIEIMKDKNLLVMEREYHFYGHTITLKKVPIMQCDTQMCPAQTLGVMETIKGWKVDNFEGLTRIKENTYLMISDDNDSFLQKCIIVLFEVI